MMDLLMIKMGISHILDFTERSIPIWVEILSAVLGYLLGRAIGSKWVNWKLEMIMYIIAILIGTICIVWFFAWYF